jgi:predicted transcriptional regulator
LTKDETAPKSTFKDIASKTIVFCTEEDTVSTIARKMRDHWTDTIFVQNSQDQVVGIITDGIIWNLIAKEGGKTDPRTLKAKNIMFRDFIRVKCDAPIESIDQLRDLLDKTKIQRIGLEQDGKIVGLIRKKFIERVKRYSRSFNFSLK